MKRAEKGEAQHCSQQNDDQVKRVCDLSKRSVFVLGLINVIAWIGFDLLGSFEIVQFVVLLAGLANQDAVFDGLMTLVAWTHIVVGI